MAEYKINEVSLNSLVKRMAELNSQKMQLLSNYDSLVDMLRFYCTTNQIAWSRLVAVVGASCQTFNTRVKNGDSELFEKAIELLRNPEQLPTLIKSTRKGRTLKAIKECPSYKN